MKQLTNLETKAMYGLTLEQYEKLRADLQQETQETEQSRETEQPQDSTPSIADLARESRIIK